MWSLEKENRVGRDSRPLWSPPSFLPREREVVENELETRGAMGNVVMLTCGAKDEEIVS